jgi:hypothetical protein
VLTHSEERDFGFDEICAALSDRFGTRFEVRHDGDDCVAIAARLEGGFEVLITDCENTLSPLHWHLEGRAAGFFVGVHRVDPDGMYTDAPGEFGCAFSETALPTADTLARSVLEALSSARVQRAP